MTGGTTPPADPLAAVLEARLSVDRLATYRAAMPGGDLQAALRLYDWNSAIAAAFFQDLGHLEVLLRNALSDQLASWHTRTGHTGHWYDDPARVLDAHRHADLNAARDQIRRNGKTETPGRIVAELNFGFWRFLLDRRYQTVLWAPALRRAFPNLQPRRRDLVYDPVQRLNRLRNRIAHHEPVHHLDLEKRHEDLLRIVGYIDPAAQTWLTAVSTVAAKLQQRPT
jgi:hypothetical protein